MRNKERWVPSKFTYQNGKLMASRNKKEIGIASRLIADLVAKLYEINIPRYVKGRLIDLGCGRVPLYAAYKNYVTDNICVDWQNTFHHNEYLDYECDLTQKLPFTEGEFDTIILSDVLEHIPYPEKLWQEMGRILAPNGKVLLNVPFFYWLHEIPYDYYRYTEYALRNFAQDAGFKVLLLKPIGGTPEIMTDMIVKHLYRIPLIGRGLSWLVYYGMAPFVHSALGQKLSLKTSVHFPLGYFMVAEKIV